MKKLQDFCPICSSKVQFATPKNVKTEGKCGIVTCPHCGSVLYIESYFRIGYRLKK